MFEEFKVCELCPRKCGVDRASKEKGFCGETDEIRIAYVGPHFGEEPPITGRNGSGTVFFTGCSLKCKFCQNHQISRGGIGKRISTDQLIEGIIDMIEENGVHNLNFVTPDHFFPYVFHAVSEIRSMGYNIPVVLNVSGYQSMDMVNISSEFTDIYLPDFKYADKDIARILSSCGDYPSVALDAISAMVSQKGFLNTFFDGTEVAKRGVLVRHLVLPGMIKNSIDALSMLRIEFGEELPISIMSQYRPVVPQKIQDLDRSLSKEEYKRVYEHAMELGFKNLFIQPIPEMEMEDVFNIGVPDFTKEQPFRWGSGRN